MRNLVFKNLTSQDRRRRRIASSETMDGQGIHTIIRRHFVCRIKEIEKVVEEKMSPEIYVKKERNNAEQTEKFFCKIKSQIYIESSGKLYRIDFMHTLKICLKANFTLTN
ncbi:MAG TPA: hypothetical protein PKL77_07615 [Candidatus Omnitrophota bacterium]|nr:hypothetical protein [Candidatus Omnitrophota bacterium]HNX81995.1 hypothetical protein [Candidatus Omnitrophota bacterium]